MKLFTTAALLAALSTPVAAQVVCALHANLIASLDMQYGESRRGVGLSGPKLVFEIWASDEPPYTWTILKVYPGGQACVMASGDGWQIDEPVEQGDPI